MELLENQQKRHWASVMALSVLATGSIIGTSIALEGNAAQKYRSLYEQNYTEPNGCLNGTVFDPNTGAFVNLDHDSTSGEDVMSVLPRDANSITPSVLFFLAVNNKLLPADYTTADYLDRSHCQS